MNQDKLFDHSQQEGIGQDMRPDAVDMGGLVVMQKAGPHHPRTDRQIDSQVMTHHESIVEGLEMHHTRMIPQPEHLIIGLAIVGRKTNTHRRQVELITQQHRIGADL